MKRIYTFTIILICFLFSFAQETEKIKIPKGVVYNYVENSTNEKAKKLIQEGLLKNDYSLLGKNLMIGPTLWKRFEGKENLKKIPGKVEFHIDDLQVDGKMAQNLDDSKKIWEELKKEISGDFKVRKANEAELNYYWATISFDIEEPLFIVETQEHIFILNFLKKDLKLFWIDEFPQRKTINNPIDKTTYETKEGFKTYENGKEVYVTDKGQKETKLEKVVFLSSDDDLKKNTSVEEISKIIDKTNAIFNELFKNSKKEGKIMIQFELGKDKNNIQFAVKNDLDLEIMKEFEKRVNEEKYPNSKKDKIKFMIIYKVNSYDDSEL